MGAALINFELKKIEKSMSNKTFAKDKSVLGFLPDLSDVLFEQARSSSNVICSQAARAKTPL
jgi:hypothetical protein